MGVGVVCRSARREGSGELKLSMAVTYDLVRDVSRELYARALMKIPQDTHRALAAAEQRETDDKSRRVLRFLQASARKSEAEGRHACSDAGFPTFFVKIGTRLTLDLDLRRAFVDGFAAMVETIDPPILKFITNPLTQERSYAGKDMPNLTFDVLDGADYLEITCSPKALGSGRWAALEVFSYPTLEQIEAYVIDCVMRAGSQHCPPVIIGVGIGGSFDNAAKIAKRATLREIGTAHPEPMVAGMEARLLEAVNATGFGPMGQGGDTTALAVHVDYSAGHGFVPVAVCFNCWINRRTTARIHNDGTVINVE